MINRQYHCYKIMPFFTGVFSVFILTTSAYAGLSIDTQLSFMESARHIALFKGMSVFAVLIVSAKMLLTRQPLNSIRSTSIGVLLTIYALLMVTVSQVNYIVIGMGLIAISDVVLVFYTSIGKLIYIFGVLFMSVFASIEHGAGSREFFYSVGFLYVIGAGLFIYVEDESTNESIAYSSVDLLDDEQWASQVKMNQKLLNRAENMHSIDYDEAKVWVVRVALSLLLLAVVMMAISIYG